MNAFQILDSNNKAISINELDKQACQVWNRELSDREYACPSDESHLNWFDMIGFKIANQSNYHTLGTWTNVKHTIHMSILERKITDSKTGELSLSQEDIDFVRQYIKPYIDLINHWESLGYIPLQIIQ